MRRYTRLALEMAVAIAVLCMGFALPLLRGATGTSTQSALATAGGTESPLVAFHVELNVPGVVDGNFAEFSGLGNQSAVVKRVQHGVSQEVPGAAQPYSFVLARGIASAMDVWQWRALVLQNPANARKNGTLTIYDEQSRVIAEWTFVRGWPYQYQVDNTVGDSGVERVWVMCDSMTRVK